MPSNRYSGATTIDSGTQGPGIDRVRGQHALGMGGVVVIGEQGNNTTARLELENGSLVSNMFNLSGRSNTTAGIVNNSRGNTISGSIRAQAGGVNYLIQSDAGLLRLSGGSSAAGGVSLSSLASGTRTFLSWGRATA